MSHKELRELSIVYSEGSNTIRTSTNCLVAWRDDDRWVLDIDGAVNFDLAVMMFKRWFQIHTYATPVLLAKALDDAINHELKATIVLRDVCLYNAGGALNIAYIKRAVRMAGLYKDGDKFSATHDIAGGYLRVWVNDEIISDYTVWS